MHSKSINTIAVAWVTSGSTQSRNSLGDAGLYVSFIDFYASHKDDNKYGWFYFRLSHPSSLAIWYLVRAKTENWVSPVVLLDKLPTVFSCARFWRIIFWFLAFILALCFDPCLHLRTCWLHAPFFIFVFLHKWLALILASFFPTIWLR